MLTTAVILNNPLLWYCLHMTMIQWFSINLTQMENTQNINRVFRLSTIKYISNLFLIIKTISCYNGELSWNMKQEFMFYQHQTMQNNTRSFLWFFHWSWICTHPWVNMNQLDQNKNKTMRGGDVLSWTNWVLRSVWWLLVVDTIVWTLWSISWPIVNVLK